MRLPSWSRGCFDVATSRPRRRGPLAALSLVAEGVNPTRVTAKSGVYSEDRRVLNLDGGVKMSGGDVTFDTASSIFNTATGELEGEGLISGASSLGEITAKSYGVYDKGERLVFKGGVRGRIDSK